MSQNCWYTCYMCRYDPRKLLHLLIKLLKVVYVTILSSALYFVLLASYTLFLHILWTPPVLVILFSHMCPIDSFAILIPPFLMCKYISECFCVETMRFLIWRNRIKRRSISADASSIRNRHSLTSWFQECTTSLRETLIFSKNIGI
jgi:hypothetical protein